MLALTALIRLHSFCSEAQATPPVNTPPDWVVKLFPSVSAPDRLKRRLRRLSVSERNVHGVAVVTATVELMYPDMYGKDHLGQANIFLPASLRDNPTRRVPLMHNAGYEIDETSAAGLLAKGYAVCTPHAEPLHPLHRNVNLDLAILHATRSLPFVDPLRVSIQGGSAGGWMTLMLTADAFPLVCSMPDVPLIHFGYNIAYLEANREAATAQHGADKPNMPYLAAVSTITDRVKPFYGMPYESVTYLGVSPLAHIDTITAPTLTTFSTADVLVPIDQVSPSLTQRRDPSLFLKEYDSAMTTRFPGIRGKRTLLEALGSRRYDLFTVPVAIGLPRIKLGAAPPSETKQITLPFSQRKIWSITVIDEGAAEPSDAHTKYVWGMNHEPFRKWAEERGVTADQLTMPKLQRLMMRLKGEAWRPIRVRSEGRGEEIDGNQMDYPEAERADVTLGLTAFATDDVRAIRLARLYSRLPSRLKVLGASLGDGTAKGARSALEMFAATGAQRTP